MLSPANVLIVIGAWTLGAVIGLVIMAILDKRIYDDCFENLDRLEKYQVNVVDTAKSEVQNLKDEIRALKKENAKLASTLAIIRTHNEIEHRFRKNLKKRYDWNLSNEKDY